MKLILFFIAISLTYISYSQYDGREYFFRDITATKVEIDKGIIFIKSKADSIKENMDFEGGLKINIVYYQEKNKINRRWNCFASKLAKRVEKILDEKPKIITSDETMDGLPVEQSCVAISPMWQ